MNGSLRPPRVCLIAPLPPPYGGIARWTELITGYAARTGKAHMHVIDTAPRWRATHDLRVWRRIVFGTLHGVAMLAQVVWELARGAQVMHITTSGQLAIYRDISMMYLARTFRVPVLYHLRFGRVPELAEACNREWRVLAKAMKLASKVIPIDHQTEETLRLRMPRVKLHPIPNCVDPTSLPEISPSNPEDPKILLFVGWVIRSKGIEELLEAWGRIEAPDWRLVLLGPVAEEYRQYLQAQHAMDRVEFLCERTHREALEWMSQADIFVLPSHTEGFPNVVVEAMALGRPILASAVGALPEMLENGRSGILVPKQDIQALYEALSHLIQNVELRESYGCRARERFLANYTLESVFARLTALWQAPR
jgi:glycosyltransferase involved in cell wall biosynthesis